MAITATGVHMPAHAYDPLRGLTAPFGFVKVVTGHWAAQSGATQDGVANLVILNQYGRFPEEVYVRMAFVNNAGFGSATDRSKVISGNTKEETVNVSRTVRVYQRSSGRFVAEVTSDDSGNFTTFNKAWLNGAEYQVVALDAVAAPDFNDFIHSKVIPL